MVGKKRFVVLTGAGLSAASGVPTFRGNEGFWKTKKNYGGESDPTALLLTEFFFEKPEAVWEWHYDFIKLCEEKKPNAGHIAINKFQEHCLKKGIECMHVTQNIDDFHCQLIKKSSVLSKEQDKFF